MTLDEPVRAGRGLFEGAFSFHAAGVKNRRHVLQRREAPIVDNLPPGRPTAAAASWRTTHQQR
jgi:hypothetical protein